jgi:hypothetical protein
MGSNFFKDVGDELAGLVAWIKEQMEKEEIRKSIAEDLGLEPGQSLSKPQGQKLDAVDSYRSKANPDKEAFIALMNDALSLYHSVRNCVSGFGPTDTTRINAVVYALFDVMAQNYVRLYLPRLYFTIQALAAMVEDSSGLVDDPYSIERFFTAVAKAEKFALSPIGYTYETMRAGCADENRAKEVSDRIFPQLAILLSLAKNINKALKPITTRAVIYGWDRRRISDISENSPCGYKSASPTEKLADPISERMLSFVFPRSQDPTATATLDESFGLSMALAPKTHTAKPGLFVGVAGDGTVEIPIGESWKFLLEASAKPAFSFLIKAEDWDFDTGAAPPANVPLNVALVSVPGETDVSFAIPHPNETHLDIGQVNFAFTFDGKTGGVRAQALRCALVIAPKDHDGFLAKFLPADGLRVPFNFGVGIASGRGFYKEGNLSWPSARPKPVTSSQPAPLTSPEQPDGPGIHGVAAKAGPSAISNDIPQLSSAPKPEIGIHETINIGKVLLNLTIDHLLLGLSPSGDGDRPAVEVSVSVLVKIGPVVAVVDRMGLEFGAGFPESGGNAGFADFSMGFKPPQGVGIKVESPVVSGGGFLFINAEKGLYSGFVQLTIHDTITVTAIGLIATRLPNGAKGFSFLVLITAQGFKPIPLGLGFTLTGIGGLLAINRSCNDEFLREGIKSGTLNDILFPQDPIQRASQIFATLSNAFPVTDGNYLFGPVVQICWGSPPAPPVLTMDLGIVVEVGHRTRVIVLGRVSAILPKPEEELIRLNMNTFGVIDFDQKSIALDAVLYDSRLVNKFPITGTMAMRLNWGDAPMFALTVGGFHPAFKPPSNFPAQQRLAISISDTEDFRLRLEAYFAITSNTVQFGAHADLFAKASGFTVVGRYGYDVLIQFDPFGFIADFDAAVQIKRGSHNLLKVQIHGELAGPRPLHINGKVTFEILWVDFTVSIDRTLIPGERPSRLEKVRVMERLKAALEDPRNWTGPLADGERRAVALREMNDSPHIAMHPLGTISVKQKVVPLGLEIAKFGNAIPADAGVFRISTFSINGKVVPVEPENDFFAPAQFMELTDDEKLAAPSFESMTAGFRALTEDFTFTSNDADVIESAMGFEDKIIDDQYQAPAVSVTDAPFDRQILLGAAARSVLRRSGLAKYRNIAAEPEAPKKAWTIISAADGAGVTKPATYAESLQTLRRTRRESPAKARDLVLARVKD